MHDGNRHQCIRARQIAGEVHRDSYRLKDKRKAGIIAKTPKTRAA